MTKDDAIKDIERTLEHGNFHERGKHYAPHVRELLDRLEAVTAERDEIAAAVRGEIDEHIEIEETLPGWGIRPFGAKNYLYARSLELIDAAIDGMPELDSSEVWDLRRVFKTATEWINLPPFGGWQ